MSEERFPVISERRLAAPVQRLFRGARRQLGELPEQPPGTVLVFEVDNQFRLAPSAHLTGIEPEVVGASGVSVVSIREQPVTVRLTVPSASAADDFTITVRFLCQVVRPEVVARLGLGSVSAYLHRHLSKDRTLTAKCAAYEIDDIALIRDAATARITAYCEFKPPKIDGMTVSLGSVTVDTPTVLRTHTQGLRDAQWLQLRETLERQGEREAVGYLDSMLSNPALALALAVQRGGIDPGEAARQVANEDAQRRDAAIKLVNVMVEKGWYERIPIDIKALFDAAVNGLMAPGATVGATRLDQGATPSPEIGGPEAGGGRFVADPDDLAGE